MWFVCWPKKTKTKQHGSTVNNFEFSLTEDWLLITIDFSSSSIGAAASNSLIWGSGAGGEVGDGDVGDGSEPPANRARRFRRIYFSKYK